MGTPYLGEIKIISWNFAPQGWAFCNGQLLPINQNQALFSILGTTYGGDGRTTFGLPDLRARVPIHTGSGHTLGERAGEAAHTLSMSEMPQHIHLAQASTNVGTALVPANGLVFGKRAAEIYHAPTNLAVLKQGTVTNVGGSQPHENRQPFLALNLIIALIGIFPSQN